MNFLKAALPTCMPIGFWDQSEWLECVHVLDVFGEVIRSRLIAEKKLTSMGVVFGWSKEFG
jgi:hypothetical protein